MLRAGYRGRIAWIALAACLTAMPAFAQIIIIPPHPPHPRPTPRPPISEYRVSSVETNVQIRDQSAHVQISQVFQNTSSQVLEGTFFFPLPENANISGLTLLVDGKELPGKLLPKEQARKIYEEIVRRQRDPALLEYMGQGLFQTSVFPIPGQASRTVQIRYTQLLKQDSGLVDFTLPLGTNKFSNKPIDKLKVSIRIEAREAIKSIHSPSHQLTIQRPDDTHAVCELELKDVLAPQDLRLLYGTQNGQIGMHVITYRPNAQEDGYFLLLASPDVSDVRVQPVAKTVLMVIDKSGSMSGDKINQAKEAVKFVLRQLRPEDLFNIVAYDNAVEAFKPELQKADEATINAALGYAENLFAGGGTNINDALQTALRMLADRNRPNYVMFLTDGLPTAGEVNELMIAKNTTQANSVQARVFAFGVGYDVNSRLLDRLVRDQRGQSIYVKPNESIEGPVASLATKITAPLLTNLQLGFEFDTPLAAEKGAAVTRVYPAQLPDLFRGEQLVVVGRYRANGAAKITLKGSIGGQDKSFVFPGDFVPQSVEESNGFVEKLWATRRIGEIIDQLDLHGQNKELVDELVQLSLKHGIITPYTSFLADEGTDLYAAGTNVTRAAEQVRSNLSVAGGRGGFAQRALKGRLQAAEGAPAAASAPLDPLSDEDRISLNNPTPAKSGQKIVYQDAEGKSQVAESVLNVGQKTFYRRNNQWRDSSVSEDQEKKARHVKQFSEEYFNLAARNGGQMSKYLAFTEPVLVNLENETILIEPDEPAPQP